MMEIDNEILKINKVICSNIEKFDSSERGLLSQNIISQLRNLVEHTSLKIFAGGHDIKNTYPNIQEALLHIRSNGNYKFLSRFHKQLQISASHYTLDEENSERLALKYYEYLIQIKTFLKSIYDLDILENINDFPLHIDSNLKEYYEKISAKINIPKPQRSTSTYKDRYYIQKIKPFFINHIVYYEVTFTRAHSKVSKFDRIIAFTNLDISANYAVKLSISNDNIQILNKSMPIQIIDKWEVSIRPCELNNFAKIFNSNHKYGGSKEYHELMRFLTSSGYNLVDLLDLDDTNFFIIKAKIFEAAQSSKFFEILQSAREIVNNNLPGTNVIRYLLYNLNNRIIKKQYKRESCNLLSNLMLKYGCIPFDQMPFNSSLINHNPKLSVLFDCISSTEREPELFARMIKNNTEKHGLLYTQKKEITSFEEVTNLINKYNDSLYYKHNRRKIDCFKDHIYIREYEEDAFHIVTELKTLSSTGLINYEPSVIAWLDSSSYNIDCDEKINAIKAMFADSKVALLYGAAGTGKSTMINHISNFFDDDRKLFLANTNPAIDNLKRKVNAPNCSFKTISKHLSHWNEDTTYDILVIDECSTVSNQDMRAVLENSTFKLLILVGDIHQIESILFGNWFNLVKSFVPSSSVFELTKPYRSNNENLLNLWSKVRNVEENILEHITKNNYSVSLDDSIFKHSEEDEIILCLNYDGLYGINNINPLCI